MGREDLLSVGKPILFNTDMVRAILDGRKTVTRRVIKNLDIYENNGMIALYEKNEDDAFSISPIEDAKKVMLHYSRYQPGDILYVRETWCNANNAGFEPDYYYFADTYICEDYIESEWKWRPSIHMPKEAARIFLRVTDVRVERLKDMTLDNFLAEGVVLRPEAFNDPENAYWQARKIFSGIWDSTIPKKDLDKYGFEANPWELMYGFERVEV